MKRFRHILFGAIPALIFVGCTAKTWDVRQVETTFVNQTDNREYVQKNAVLFNSETGESYVFSSDENSHYHWEKVPVKSR